MGRPWLPLARTVPRLGPWRLARYAQHQARLRSGWYVRHHPTHPWVAPGPGVLNGAGSPWSAPDRDALRALVADVDDARAEAERVLAGDVLYFGWDWRPRPADWCTHPITGHRAPIMHWSQVEDLPDPNAGDVKWIWEPSRFRQVHQLLRAWLLTDDDRYKEGFWALLRDWREHNRPNAGANWKCGQECSIRLMVLTWAAGILGDLDEQQHLELWSTVAALAERVEGSLGYAISQRNPHGLAEAVALELAGHALPQHPRAHEWREVGRALFVEQALDQWDTDGYYLSNANNYARVVLRYGCVALTTARWVGKPLPPGVVSRLEAAARYLWQHQDPTTGAVPNHGANDGGHLFVTHGCHFDDFRPTLQLAFGLTAGRRLYRPGPWDEPLLWETGRVPPAEELPARDAFVHARTSGSFVLRGDDSFAAMRCFSHVGRPSQADMLHLDVWRGGRNVLADGGSYQYNEPRGWGKHLKETCGHNTLEVDGRSQMLLASTFLYVDWTKAKALRVGRPIVGWAGDGAEGEHYSYVAGSGVVHRRLVLRWGDDYLIVDDGLPAADRPWSGTLRWHYGAGDAWTAEHSGARTTVHSAGLVLDVLGPQGARGTLLQGEEHLPAAGRSRTYARIDAFAVVESARPTGPGAARWITGLGDAPLDLQGSEVRWRGLRVPTLAGASVTAD